MTQAETLLAALLANLPMSALQGLPESVLVQVSDYLKQGKN